MKNSGFLILFIALGLFLTVQSAWCERAYVTDTFKITLRTGPTVQNKIITLLSSGQPLEILDSKEEWSYVLISGQDGEEVKGWLLNRYIIKRMPWETQARYLQRENKSLKEKLSRAVNERNETTSRANEASKELDSTTRALNKLQKEYEALKKGAAQYLELSAAYETAKSEFETAKEKVKNLTIENEKLRSSERNKWFAIGAIILLFGLIFGMVIGKREKKRKSLIYQ
ncbi:MAG: TIGR04211 family SH3 domain-containing protein [Thermodesulfobacteriota bacterium]|nr:TIGR04211 family SH3 domain-containing protein [Thermodesulfobacteriota bacterium]